MRTSAVVRGRRDIVRASRLAARPLLVLAGLLYLKGRVRRFSAARRRRLETLLDETRGRLQAIVENSNAVIFVKDADGRYLLVNGRYEEAFHFKGKEEVLGRTDYDLFPPEEAAVFRANDMDVARTGRAVELDEQVQLDDGPHDYISLKFPLRDAKGNVYAVGGIATDVTRRKRAERDLRHSLSLLEATLDSTADGILVVDKTGRIVQFNHRFVELWRIPEAIVTERNDEQALAFVLGQLADPEQFLNRVRDLYGRPTESSFDVLRFKDGQTFERHSQPQYLGDEVVGRVWSFRDVTARVRAEQQRDRLLAEEQRARTVAEDAVRMRDDFLSIASHELRTPLSGLQLAVQVLERSFDTMNPREVKGVATVSRQCRRLTKLVGLLLDVSRIQLGQLELEWERFDLRSVVEETVMQEREAQGGAPLGPIVVKADRPVLGTWDRARLEQVVTNLLGNAVKFGQGKPIEIALGVVGDNAVLTVADHGIGIPEDVQARLFERFQRGVSSRHYGGLGLGLFISRTIVEAHGGRIDLESSPGEGTTFTVVLPMRRGSGEGQ